MRGSKQNKKNQNITELKEELIEELAECREDERNSQSQIVQVIATAGTVLGILFSASFLTETTGNEINLRWTFYLSCCVFCVAFTYILNLGTSNVFRYHYVRMLEDTLFLQKKSNEDKKFIHWESYFGIITTRIPSHIFSSHALVYFISYSIAVFLTLIFCVALLMVEYARLDVKNIWDKCVGLITIFFALIDIFLFIRTANNSESASKIFMEMGNLNRNKRLGIDDNTEREKRVKDFWHTLKYLIYPKMQDPQKPLLLLLIFCLYSFVQYGMQFKLWNWNNAIWSFCVFELLAYQIRYQFNDIYGYKEDVTLKRENRLLTSAVWNDEEKIHRKIKLSLKAILVKLVIIILIILTQTFSNKIMLLIQLGILICISVLYEYFKAKKQSNVVYSLVGLGYPLRFAVGITAANQYAFGMNRNIINSRFVLLSLWAYGTCASVLMWAKEVNKKYIKAVNDANGFDKKVFENQILCKNYYIDIWHRLCENGKKIDLLKERKGKLTDIWNLSYLLAMAILFFIICRNGVGNFGGYSLFVIDIVFIITNVIMCISKYHFITCIGNILVALLKFVFVCIGGAFSFRLTIDILQILYLMTYIYARFMESQNTNVFKTIKLWGMKFAKTVLGIYWLKV